MKITIKQEKEKDIELDLPIFELEKIDIDSIDMEEVSRMNDSLKTKNIIRVEVVLIKPIAATDFSTAVADNTNIKEYILHLTNKN